MRIIPKNCEEGEHNTSKVHPLKEFFMLIFGTLAIVAIIYYLSGFAVGIVVENLSSRYESKLMGLMSRFDVEGKPDQKMQKLLDALVKKSDLSGRKFELFVIEGDDPNALAYPGQKIVVVKSLLDQVNSQNELAMVLAHELGHFKNRDHLRGAGRGVIATIASLFLFGQDSQITNFLLSSVNMGNLDFTREQELKADQYGLKLLNDYYGHVNGSLNFFESQYIRESKLQRHASYISTHPNATKRINELVNWIKENDLSLDGELIPKAVTIQAK